jgi:hypothetical protein
VSGSATVPPARARYPFSAYALSVWHGSGRPIHDAGTQGRVSAAPLPGMPREGTEARV